MPNGNSMAACLEAAAGVVPLVSDDAKITQSLEDGLDVAANLRPGFDWNLMGLFHRDDAAVGPCVLGDGIESGGKVADADVQIAAASTDGAQHSTLSERARVRVGHEDVQRDHAALHREVGVLPRREAVHGHVSRLRGRRDQLQLLASIAESRLPLLGGSDSGGTLRGAPGASGEAERENEQADSKDDPEGEPAGGGSHIDYQHTKTGAEFALLI